MNVKKWREDAGLTQAMLAKNLGIGQSQISRLEKNPDLIPFGLLRRWLARLGVDSVRATRAWRNEAPPLHTDPRKR